MSVSVSSAVIVYLKEKHGGTFCDCSLSTSRPFLEVGNSSTKKKEPLFGENARTQESRYAVGKKDMPHCNCTILASKGEGYDHTWISLGSIRTPFG